MLEGHKTVGINCAFSPSGDLLVSGDWSGVTRLWDGRTGQQFFHMPAATIGWPRFSPDGSVLAAQIKGHQLRLLRVERGREVRTLVPATAARLSGRITSPDGRWLATSSGGGCRLWAVETWEAAASFPGVSPVFSADSRLLAVGDEGLIRLVHPATGRRLAVLEAPGQLRQEPNCFTPDGDLLIASCYEVGTLLVWDLRAIRARLAEMGLDWDLPPYPPAKPLPQQPRAIGADIDGLRAVVQARGRLRSSRTGTAIQIDVVLGLVDVVVHGTAVGQRRENCAGWRAGRDSHEHRRRHTDGHGQAAEEFPHCGIPPLLIRCPTGTTDTTCQLTPSATMAWRMPCPAGAHEGSENPKEV